LKYTVRFTPLAAQMLGDIGDERERRAVLARVQKLAQDPEGQGKALVGEFMGLRSVRAVGQRYRIVFRVNLEAVEVLIVGVGLRRAGNRRDIYERLVRARKRRS
jgi:mRNA interferase RelE/StbE